VIRRRYPSWRRGIGFLAIFGLAVAMSAAWSTDGSAATQQASLQLKGEGSWGAYRELLTWQNDLSDAKTPIDLSYAAHGSLLGRQDFLAGSIDYVLSAIPFTGAELEKIPGGASGVIGAPVQVSSLTALLQRPVPDGFTTLTLLCDPDDPEVLDPGACIVRTQYKDAVKVPNVNLAAMLMRYAGGTTPPLSSWNSPGVLSAMSVENFTTPPLAGPAPVLRSDQDEFNYYLQQYVAQGAPSVWSGLKAQDTRIPWEPISERLGRQASASRDGVEQQAQQLALGGGDPGSGTISGFTAGVVAAVPASAIGEVRETFPKSKVEFIELQNANGDWVAPTPESITRAVEAGGTTPLYALTNKVPGAYPLAWVDYLWAPAHGLSREKAEALATVIRYLATAGQRAAAPVGEGKLSAALTKKALAAADEIVRSNCKDKVVENTDPGPYAPDLPDMKTIGTMAHCTGGSTDTPAPPAGDIPAGSTSDYSSGIVSSSNVSTSAPPVATEPVADTPEATKQQRDAVLAATKLPLPFPSSTSGIDRLATLVLGAGLYLALRRPVRRMLARGRPT
jgi:hypothetical protein